jgi:NMD protein affecting ribosome stability and mRNA decay
MFKSHTRKCPVCGKYQRQIEHRLAMCHRCKYSPKTIAKLCQVFPEVKQVILNYIRR